MSDVTPNNNQVIFLLRADDELYQQLTTECNFHGRQLINFNTDDAAFIAFAVRLNAGNAVACLHFNAFEHAQRAARLRQLRDMRAFQHEYEDCSTKSGALLEHQEQLQASR